MSMRRAVALTLFASTHGQGNLPTVAPVQIITANTPTQLQDLGATVSGISDGSKMPCYDGNNCPDAQQAVQPVQTDASLQAAQVTAPPPPPVPTLPATEAPVAVTAPPTPEVTMPPTPEVTVPPTPEVPATPEPPTIPPTQAPPTLPATSPLPAAKDLTTVQMSTMEIATLPPVAGLVSTTTKLTFLEEDEKDLTGGSGGSPWMWILIVVGLAGVGSAAAYFLGVCGGEKPKKQKKKTKRAVKPSSVVQETRPLVNSADVEAPAAEAPAPVQTSAQPMQQFVSSQAQFSYVAAPQLAVAAPRMAGSIVIHPDGSRQVVQ